VTPGSRRDPGWESWAAAWPLPADAGQDRRPGRIPAGPRETAPRPDPDLVRSAGEAGYRRYYRRRR